MEFRNFVACLGVLMLCTGVNSTAISPLSRNSRLPYNTPVERTATSDSCACLQDPAVPKSICAERACTSTKRRIPLSSLAAADIPLTQALSLRPSPAPPALLCAAKNYVCSFKLCAPGWKCVHEVPGGTATHSCREIKVRYAPRCDRPLVQPLVQPLDTKHQCACSPNSDEVFVWLPTGRLY
jgi:hypothetical protein